MKAPTFRPRTERERLAVEVGRSLGLREAFQILAQSRTGEVSPPTEQATAPAPEAEPSADVMQLEDLLVGLGFTPFRDEENPARQWRRGEEEVAIDEACVQEQVRWWPPDPEREEPDTMTVAAALRRAMEESRKR